MIYSKVPTAFHQHHYIANGISTPSKKVHNFTLSPPPKDINRNFEMLNAYTTQSSSTPQNGLRQQQSSEIDDANNPIYHTP